MYFIDEDNNDHDDNSINLAGEKDLYIAFITSLPKQGKKTMNGTAHKIMLMSLLSCKWMTFFTKKKKYLFVFRKKERILSKPEKWTGGLLYSLPFPALSRHWNCQPNSYQSSKEKWIYTNVWMKIQVWSQIFFLSKQCWLWGIAGWPMCKAHYL